MATKVTIVLTGDSALNAKLRELTSKQAKEAIRKAARPALQGTLAAARSLAPKRTGNMAKNIKIRAITRSRSRVGMRVTLSKQGDYSGKAFYGAFQNYGWKTGSRRNTLERATARFARALRAESRAAGSLKSTGSAFRDRQEKYFRDEGARRALGGKVPIRRQIEGKRFMNQAAEQTRTSAIKIYREGIRTYILSVTRT